MLYYKNVLCAILNIVSFLPQPIKMGKFVLGGPDIYIIYNIHNSDRKRFLVAMLFIPFVIYMFDRDEKKKENTQSVGFFQLVS